MLKCKKRLQKTKQWMALSRVNVHYDASDKCHEITAIFGYKPSPPVFTLYGHIVDGMTDAEVASILRSIEAGVSYSYTAINSLSAGLCAKVRRVCAEHGGKYNTEAS